VLRDRAARGADLVIVARANVSCVAIEGRAVLIEGPPGGGKSSLALALIDRGAALVGDDGVHLEPRGDRLWALPPPAIAGKLEIRNVGIVELPAVEAPIALAVVLREQAPRYVEQAETVVIEGFAIPLVLLWPESPVLAQRVEWALRLHGLG
jgi:serine kinase of HPr protein (carbohydrate metabolism regulator)